MRDSVLWLLIMAVMLSSMTVVYMRHQHRITYLALQKSMQLKDKLNVEWSQLLIEESFWSFPHRVEKDATRNLSMKVPTEQDIIMVEH